VHGEHLGEEAEDAWGHCLFSIPRTSVTQELDEGAGRGPWLDPHDVTRDAPHGRHRLRRPENRKSTLDELVMEPVDVIHGQGCEI
jgi:hypothetical protein